MAKTEIPDGWICEAPGGWNHPKFGTVFRERNRRWWGVPRSKPEIGPFRSAMEAASAVEAAYTSMQTNIR